jgi:lipopolysaccharide/colanic/teichoic acid biosynthesis glycosyltransferase
MALAPLLLLVTALVRASMGGQVLFSQERIGVGGSRFTCWKFRTMPVNADEILLRHLLANPEAAREWAETRKLRNDPRVGCLGSVLRKSSLDELPQLFNVLAGDMSLVGPRPEVPEYVERFRADYVDILTVRPGMTDLASLKYRDESALLAAAADPSAEYLRVILPDKIRLAREYVRRSSVLFDLSLILRTLGAVVGGRPQ